MNNQFDVAIVGAGMVGIALAAGLAQGNTKMRIALVDPAMPEHAPALGTTLNDFDRRVVALSAQSKALLEELGAWQKLPPERLSPYTGMHVWDGEGTGSITFDATDLHLSELGHIIENRQLVWALMQVAQQYSNISFIKQPAQYLDNRQANGYTPLGLANGELILATLIIGADGALSRVRQWAGLPTREWDYDHHAIVATVRTEKPHQATAWQRFRQEGPLAFLPLPDPHLVSIVWSTSPTEAKHVLAMSAKDFNQALTQAFEGRLGQVLETTAKVSIPLRQRHAKDYWTEGIALAGDAAHVIHPLAGQGVNLGFKDVRVLLDEILRGFNQKIDIGSAAVLGRYQRRRQADNLATMAMMEGFKRLFGAEHHLARLLRNEGMRWFDKFLPVKQHVMMQAMGIK